jgi:glutathione S-transferase
MQLYVTFTSPYARLARILVIEKGLTQRVTVIEAKTRTVASPYYAINPSGRVPYLIDEAGVGMEDSQLICAYLDALDGAPRFHAMARSSDWAYRGAEAIARSLCDGISVWVREMHRPANERSPTVLAHEAARGERLANVFEQQVAEPPWTGTVQMPHLILAVALDVAHKRGPGDLTRERPRLAAWHQKLSELPSLQATALP